MGRIRMLLYGAAMAALLPAAACSSDGRVAMSGASGLGAGPGGRQAEDPNTEGGGEPPAQPSQPASLVAAVDDTSGAVLAAAGNLGQPGDGALRNAVNDTTGSLRSTARVTVADETIGGDGDGASPIGVSLASDTQNQGSSVTLGVLSNGQVATANVAQLSGAGQGDLIGAVANDDQVIGEGNQQAIGVGLLTSNTTSGEAASVNALSGGQTANVQVNGTPLTPGTPIVGEITEAVSDLLDGGG